VGSPISGNIDSTGRFDELVDATPSNIGSTVRNLPNLPSIPSQLTADEMRDRGKAKKTWNKYGQHWTRFRNWLVANGHTVILIDGRDLTTKSGLFASIRIPIPLPIFESYLMFLVHKKNNTLKSISVPQAFWAALIYAHDCSEPHIGVPESLRFNWKKYQSGYQRVGKQQVEDLGLSVYEGKDSLTRKAFRNLQELTMSGRLNQAQLLWIPQMNAGTRNLIARVCSIGALVTSTMRWKNDCLCITLPRHKGDQTGERTIERHVHANATDPLSCFIFWLGIRILCESTSGTSHYLFGDEMALELGGGRRSSMKDEEFGRWMRKIMGDRPLKEQIDLFDGPAVDFCTQSNRKGGMEELTTSPDGPPPVAALLRSGHAIGGNAGVYLLQMHGGDEFCSRICAGFDLQHRDFALLPPHFRKGLVDSINWNDFVWNYSLYPTCFQTTVPWLVAAVVYQWSTGWIQRNFPSHHPLFTSRIQPHMRRLACDGNILVPHLLCGDCGLRATGIPQQVVCVDSW